METNEEMYERDLANAKHVIKHAKLDERKLTQITQALYFPSSESSNLHLLELDQHLLQEIQIGQNLYFKGSENEKAVLCTASKTYEIKETEISNSLLLVPDLKFARATSSSPLKSPNTAQSSLKNQLNSSNEDDDDQVEVERSLEKKKISNIFHQYFECRQIKPRFRKLFDILQLTRYSGPENEQFIDRKLLFNYKQLLGSIQCSESEFLEGLQIHRVFEYEGYMRMLEYEYEYRVINLMLDVVNENSWPLDEVIKDETITALDGIIPHYIVEAVFKQYTIPNESKPSHYSYREDLVCRIVAQNILQPGLKFRLEEFLSTWQEAVPEGMHCEEKNLNGLAIIDREAAIPCVHSLVEHNLPLNIYDRLRILFNTKSKWTLAEITPYVDYFTTSTLSVSSLMNKYTRSVMENGVRYYVAKH